MVLVEAAVGGGGSALRDESKPIHCKLVNLTSRCNSEQQQPMMSFGIVAYDTCLALSFEQAIVSDTYFPVGERQSSFVTSLLHETNGTQDVTSVETKFEAKE